MSPPAPGWWSTSQLLALSFELPASPRLSIRYTSVGPGATGWGLVWYPPDDRGAVVIKDPTPASPEPVTRMLSDWPRFRSSLFLSHLRGAARRMTQEDTQPFQRSYGGRQHVLAHNGALGGGFADALPLGAPVIDEPVGHTDTEHLFCWLLHRMRTAGARTLADAGWERLQGWLDEVNTLGSLNVLWSDGLHLLAYQDRQGFNRLHRLRVTEPDPGRRFDGAGVTLELGGPHDTHASALLVSTHPLSSDPWVPMADGQLLVACRGAIVWDSASAPGKAAWTAAPAMAPEPTVQVLGRGGVQAPQPAAAQAPDSAATAEDPAEPRCYDIVHITRYRYDEPVEASQHVFRLRPVHDVHQHVLDSALVVSPSGERRDYEDVFGNRASRLRLDGPYDTLQIESRSSVVVLPDGVTADFGSDRGRNSIPLVWMPWQRQMMTPYLLPLELPETQLRELFDYAMSFVERQDYDLMEVLGDINRTIRADYAYVQGVTTVETTPYEVFTTRRGVCQDFANLMICLARLLGVPARYRAGYIDTGGNYDNKVQSDASHAWVEVFLPWGGWRGFDPTNGVVVGLDHVRMATGRNYRDATPTEGTIYRGGGTETLTIDVRVRRVPLPPAYTAGAHRT